MFVSYYTFSIKSVACASGTIFHIFVWESISGPDQTHDLMIPCWNIVLWNCTLDYDTLSVDFYSYKSHLDTLPKSHLREWMYALSSPLFWRTCTPAFSIFAIYKIHVCLILHIKHQWHCSSIRNNIWVRVRFRKGVKMRFITIEIYT